jgi:hypothetical protein
LFENTTEPVGKQENSSLPDRDGAMETIWLLKRGQACDNISHRWENQERIDKFPHSTDS